jgi:hypothetical protein
LSKLQLRARTGEGGTYVDSAPAFSPQLPPAHKSIAVRSHDASTTHIRPREFACPRAAQGRLLGAGWRGQHVRAVYAAWDSGDGSSGNWRPDAQSTAGKIAHGGQVASISASDHGEPGGHDRDRACIVACDHGLVARIGRTHRRQNEVPLASTHA